MEKSNKIMNINVNTNEEFATVCLLILQYKDKSIL